MGYIAQIEGDYYEGTNVKLRLMNPQPVIFPFRVESDEAAHEQHIFVEDYFNSSTRIRRGRVYKQSIYKSWSIDRITPHPLSWITSGPDKEKCPAIINESFESDGNMAIMPGKEVVLGKGMGESSHWTVVLAEQVISYGLLITLKSKTFFGVLPELDLNAIPQVNRSDIVHALDAVAEAAPIQAPQSVIEACRNAAYHIITAKYPDSIVNDADELGKIARWLDDETKHPCERLRGLGAVVEMVNNLHNRAKANGPRARGTRPVTQNDSNLAVSAIAFLLQDIGWAEQT